jgi:hypothetical protein
MLQELLSILFPESPLLVYRRLSYLYAAKILGFVVKIFAVTAVCYECLLLLNLKRRAWLLLFDG